MKQVLLFIYTYYAYYFYVLSGVCGNGIGLCLWRKKGEKKSTTCETSVAIFSCIAVDFMLAIGIQHCIIDFISGFPISSLCAFVVACAITGIVGIIIVPTTNVMIGLLKKIKINKLNTMGKCTLAYLVLGLLLYPPYAIDSWVALWYATDYSMGMGSRFFIGSILKLFYNDFLDAKLAANFCLVFTIVSILIVTLFSNALYKKCEEKVKTALWFIWSLFLVSPGSIIALWQSGNYGRLEFWGFFIGLICILIYANAGLNIKTFIVITVLSCLSMAIYQGNIFMYYPLILMIFIWEIFNSEKRAIKIAFSAINLILTSICFLVFQFCSYTSFESAAEMTSYLSEKTNLPITEMAIDLELFQPITVAFNSINVGFLTGVELPREKTFFTMLVLSPIVVLFIGMYMKCFDEYKKNGKSVFKSSYLYFLALLFMIIPQFALNVDWGRWMISENIILFSGFLFLLWKKDIGAIKASCALSNWISRHRIVAIIVLVHVAGLGKFNGRRFITQVNSITEWIASMIG